MGYFYSIWKSAPMRAFAAQHEKTDSLSAVRIRLTLNSLNVKAAGQS